MSAAVSKTSIANRALQLVGYRSIGSINDNDRGAAAVRRAYTPVFEAALRENFWSFSIKRATLAAGAIQPAFGKANYFPLPGDFIMLAPPDQYVNYQQGAIPVGYISVGTPNTGMAYNDWQIESYPGGGQAIASDNAAPLFIRYISNDLVESAFDPDFAEVLAADLALNICEELTQSNTKLQNISSFRKAAMDRAKQRNAYECLPVQPPIDPWIIARR